MNIKKPAVAAALALAALSFAAPAHADDDAADNWSFSATDTCFQVLATALAGGPGNHQSDCSSGNVVARSGS
ncbi:hypothetical protein [Streptomyces sp. NPDC094032]|uniref:hypothetical protein n=1 Tax=Streptomyces sp. NPDC094032 TaxID=3155308 RepID=UPI0033330D31